MRRQTRRRTSLALVGLVAVGATIAGGAGLSFVATGGQHTAPPPTATASARTSSQQVRAPRPTRLSIPAIGVRHRINRLGSTVNGTIELPPYAGLGWFTGSVAPGAEGAAIVTGYIGNRAQPGALAGLGRLRRGDRISVRREDGSVADFAVDDIESYAPRELPLRELYHASRPTLRIVTTGGALRPGLPNRNVVVSATLTGIR